MGLQNKTVDLSMPGFIENTLHKFQHKAPYCPQHTHYPARTPQYGSKVQLTPKIDESPALTPAAKTRIQQVIGALLYYGRDVDPTPISTISAWALQQSTTTEDTGAKLLQVHN
jgi:hypothetical protein